MTEIKQPTCQERINEHWLSRRENFERFRQAAYGEGIFDRRDYDFEDPDITEIEGDEATFSTWTVSCMNSDFEERTFNTEAEAEAYRREIRIELGLDPDTGDRPDRESVMQEHYEYGLCFDYVAPGTFNDQDEGYWRYQLSWGGPSDEIRFYSSDGKHLYKAEYWFLDWFDGAHKLVTRDECVQWLWNDFVEMGAVEYTQEQAMEE
jgi:hypothetical protein